MYKLSHRKTQTTPRLMANIIFLIELVEADLALDQALNLVDR